MTCYQRHLGALFDALGLSYDSANRARVDRALRQVLGISDAEHCPQVWAAIKSLPPGDREALTARVAEALQSSA